MSKKVIVIGGGAAGMMAAITAAAGGAAVDLYEKNEKLGKKIFITGKGRCNLTNACEIEEYFEHICSNPRFMYSSVYGFTNQDVIRFFESRGMKTKTERGGRVFPVSDHSSDVIRALADEMRDRGVKVHLNTAVKSLMLEDTEDGGKVVRGVQLQDGTRDKADRVIVCTGGISYASTGSTGDGHRFAKAAGLKVTDMSPSLVPMNAEEADIPMMQGLSLKNVRMWIKDGKKTIYDEFGEMMFTHFGVTGPLILTASTVVQKQLAKKPLVMHIDLKPALTEAQLDARFLREFEEAKNKQFKNVLGHIYPSKMIPVIIARAGIAEETPVNEITKEQRRHLGEITKNFTLTVTSLRGYNEAIITRGGVNVRQIDPATMQAKSVEGLYFAGEVLDVDAVTGGYNLQVAWSTGHAAGLAAAEE